LPRKKSVRRAAQQFRAVLQELDDYYAAVQAAGLSDQHVTWAVEAAVIKLSAQFERLILHALVGAVNNDTSILSSRTKVRFPKHLTDEVCEYLVTGGAYFDFRGRDGLMKTLKDYLPVTHYLVVAVAKPSYRQPVEQLIALRNFAAHESATSKQKARESVGTNMSAAGSWLKRGSRFNRLSGPLRQLASDIEAGAPY
jgi:hypothetical protein